MGFSAFPSSPALQLLAATPVGGVALQNGTPTFLSYTFPNDGLEHRAAVYGSRNVTVAETGGQLTFNVPVPGGGSLANVIAAGGSGVGQGGLSQSGQGYPVPAGATVTVAQTSALTAGACQLYCELWGS